MDVEPTTGKIEEKDLHNSATADWATVAQAATRTPTEENRTQISETIAERQETHAVDTGLKEDNVSNATL